MQVSFRNAFASLDVNHIASIFEDETLLITKENKVKVGVEVRGSEPKSSCDMSDSQFLSQLIVREQNDIQEW
jgi:hypothetical protein